MLLSSLFSSVSFSDIVTSCSALNAKQFFKPLCVELILCKYKLTPFLKFITWHYPAFKFHASHVLSFNAHALYPLFCLFIVVETRKMDGGYNSTPSLGCSMEYVMRPKSPLPGLVDFHGKRKKMVKIQVLEREIGLLQEEIKSLEGLHPASRCCKEVDAFVGSVADPFTPTKQTISKCHRFRKQLSVPRFCCPNRCVSHKKMAKGCWACCSSSNSKCCCSCSYFKSACRCAQNCC